MSKSNRLFLVLGFFFVTNALIAEFVGVKIFSLELSLGFEPVNWHFLGADRSFTLTAGVILWPVVFIMTDLINEYYGKKGVRTLSYLTVVMLIYAFIMAFMAMKSTPADWWVGSKSADGIADYGKAFNSVFGQGLSIIIGSLVAFLVGQLVDAGIFSKLKQRTGQNLIWLRATGSTVVSQLIDSFVVLFVAFYLGGNWTMDQIIGVGIMNYIYKLTMAIVLIPVLYGVHNIIDRYLGKELSKEMIAGAVAE
ncbi:MAG: queuosine precursor transporter [Bacteroidetes bacterium]|nr:queuosine precursor transporter [Bacteroidota bacterium]